MTARLIVNLGSSNVTEFPLRPGANRIGRGVDNDVVIPHPSVSARHCEVLVTPEGIRVRDLESTNGTHIGGERQSEAALKPGEIMRLGEVEVLLQRSAGNPIRVGVKETATLDNSEAGCSNSRPPPIVSGITQPPAVALPRDMGEQLCRFHKTIRAHFHCDACGRSYCDLCVNTRMGGEQLVHSCRTCGDICVPLTRPQAQGSPPGFFASLPAALVYPFRGSGGLIIILATILFGLLNWFSPRTYFGIVPAYVGRLTFAFLILKLLAAGYLYSYLQSIIQATALGEKELPELPSIMDFASDVLCPALELLGLLVICFGPALLALTLGVVREEPVLYYSAIPLALLGGAYFPMAMLAVTVMNSLAAANPLFILPSVFRIPWAYATVAILMIGVHLFRQVGGEIMHTHLAGALSSTSMGELSAMLLLRLVWGLVSFYLLLVAVRALGLLYFHYQSRLGWLRR